jgi:membrane associated rhomboid family serine protease
MSDFLRPQKHGSGALATTTGRAVTAAICVALLFVTVWALEIFDWVLPGEPLDQFGIHARDVGTLPYILTAPFLHYGFDHLVANSMPLLVLGFLAAMAGIGRFGATNMIIIAVSGIGVWLTAAPNSITLGASGLIFGYFGYLIGRGLFERRTIDIVIAAVVAAVYGTMIFGALPIQEQGISWQGHLFGLIAGLLAAWALRRPRSQVAQHGRPGLPGPGSGYPGPGHPG